MRLCCCLRYAVPPASWLRLRLSALLRSRSRRSSTSPVSRCQRCAATQSPPLRQWAVAWLPGVNRAAASSEPLMPAHLLAIPVQQLLTSFVLCVCAVAHHVQKKATKHHEHSRPRKSRPSDINRTPPQYPPIPDTPWMTPTQSLKVTESKVSIQISPSDTAADLNTKLQAAGASAVERFVYKGVELTSTLAECGLKEDSSIEAKVRSYAA